MVARQKGFTLIELMLATALLSMVMFSGYYAYSLYTEKWQKRAALFWQDNKQSLAIEALVRVINATDTYIINGDGKPASLFQGDANTLTLVSGSPIFNSSKSLVRLEFIQGQNGSGKLIYSELSLAGRLLQTVPAAPEWEYRVVLLDKLSQWQTRYYGWQTLAKAVQGNIEKTELVLPQNKVTQTWYNTHLVETNRILPGRLELNFTTESGQQSQLYVDLVESSYLRLVRYLREGA